MLFKSIFTVAAFAAAAAAQTAKLAFTKTPATAQVGVPTEIKWAGGDGSPVTISLRKGDRDNLMTVAVLTGGTTGTSFTWTPTADLPNDSDYALSISQGLDPVTNYSGQFALSGGSDASVTTSATATILSLGASSTAALTTLSGPVLNMTSATSMMTSMTVPLMTAPASMGTGMTAPGNTTFSSPTLSATTDTATLTSEVASASGSDASAAASSTGAAAMLQVQGAVGAGAVAAALFWL